MGELYKKDDSSRIQSVEEILKKCDSKDTVCCMMMDEALVYDRSWEKPEIDGFKVVELLEKRGFLTDEFKE